MWLNIGATWEENTIWCPNSDEFSDAKKLENSFLDNIYVLSWLQDSFKQHALIWDDWKVSQSEINKLSWIAENHDGLKEMNEAAFKYYQENEEEYEWNLSITAVLWSLIVTYDSSVNTPDCVESNDRWYRKTVSNWAIDFSIIVIDVNLDRRKNENVTPTISLHHEFQHHLNTLVGDNMLADNNVMVSAKRHKPQPYGSRSKAEFTNEDSLVVSEMFWRNVNFSGAFCEKYEMYKSQMYYLDELSASWWQAKSNTFWPTMMFYNNITPWTHSHYDLIGDNAQDRKDLEKLFKDFLMPGFGLFYIVKKYDEAIEQHIASNNNCDDPLEKAKYQADLNSLINQKENTISKINLIATTLWSSRTVHQALGLMEIVWKTRIVNNLPDDQSTFLAEYWTVYNKYL